MKIKVLHISISDSLGGAAIAANRLHLIMNDNKNLSSKILVLIKNTSSENSVALNKIRLQFARLGNLINNFFVGLKKMEGLFSFAIIGNEIYKSWLAKNADLIYIHWVNNGMMSWKSIEHMFLLNKPIILFGHDMWYFSGGCHQSNGCKKYELGCNDCPYFDSRILKKIVKFNFERKRKAYAKNSNVVQILPSSDFYNKALLSKIIGINRLHFIENILDTEKFIPRKQPLQNNKIRILYGAMGGKTNPYKGWDDFLYFATEISVKYSKFVEIYLFGYDFQTSELDRLPFQAKNYGMIHNEEEIIKMYQESDVFVFPSKQESFGQTLIEAMACGVVPISYKVGIAQDVINTGNGLLVETNDKEGLVNAFDIMMNMDINYLKKNARKIIDEKFSKEIIVNKHIKLMKSLL